MRGSVKSVKQRRPRGSLSREQVVEAALALADGEGLEALTMQTLARRLECGVMSLYGYIDRKEELLDAIAQSGLRDLRLARPLPPDVEWVLSAWGRARRENLIEHPSLNPIFLSRAVVGPGILRGLEALLGPLARAGMPPARGVHGVCAVVTYVTGFVAWEIPRTRRQPEAAYAASWRQEFASLAPADFPFVGDVLGELPKVAGEEQFELGLAALIAGLAGKAQRTQLVYRRLREAASRPPARRSLRILPPWNSV